MGKDPWVIFQQKIKSIYNKKPKKAFPKSGCHTESIKEMKIKKSSKRVYSELHEEIQAEASIVEHVTSPNENNWLNNIVIFQLKNNRASPKLNGIAGIDAVLSEKSRISRKPRISDWKNNFELFENLGI